MKWSKRPESLTEKGELDPHTLLISRLSPKKTLNVSWHWQVGINPRQVSAISCMRSLRNCRAGLLTCLTQGVSFIHTTHRRVCKAQQKICSLGEQRTRAPSILTLPWRLLDEPPRWPVVAEPQKMPGFLASRGEFNLGPEMRLDPSELLCHKVLLNYKRDRECFWRRHQKGAERVPPC